jgi:ribosome-associated protein
MRESITIEQESSEPFALALALETIERKASEPVVLDMQGLIDFSEYFVLVTAQNARQVRAIADAVKGLAKKDYQRAPVGVEGLEACRWVLVDFGDVVVHIFDGPMRGFYDLDGLWRDAPKISIPDTAQEPDASAQFLIG